MFRAPLGVAKRLGPKFSDGTRGRWQWAITSLWPPIQQFTLTTQTIDAPETPLTKLYGFVILSSCRLSTSTEVNNIVVVPHGGVIDEHFVGEPIPFFASVQKINELLASLPRWFHPVAVARSTGRCSQYITGSVYIVQTSDLNMQNVLDSVLQLQDSIRVRCARNTRNDAAMNGVASSVLPPTQGTDQREYFRRLTGTESTAVVKARCKGPSYPRQSWTKRERHAVGAESEAPVEHQEEAQHGTSWYVQQFCC